MPVSFDTHTPAPGQPASVAAARGSGMKFADLLDVINPLQHIPVVSQIYRHLTGDSIRAPFRIAGGALFGGPLGAAFAAGGILFDAARGAATPVPTQAPKQAAVPPAPASPRFEARGGWMVAATRGAPVAPAAPAEAPATGAAERRGGWLVAAAYAHTDRMAAHAGTFSERA